MSEGAGLRDDDPMLIPTPRVVRRERGDGWASLPPRGAGVRVFGLSVDEARHWLGGAAAERGWRFEATTDARQAAVQVHVERPCGRRPRLGEASIEEQAYRLRVMPRDGEAAHSGGTSIRIESPTAAGARHGLTTARQLLRRYAATERVPILDIEDRPSFAVRGVMLDVSRDRVPTMPFLFELVETLASLKINHLQLYVEHAFAYAGHEEIWRDASPPTPEEMRALDAHAAAWGVELAANQNCFGHLTRWLSHPKYGVLAETHGEWVFDNGEVRVPQSGPFSFCPGDPRSLALIKDLLGQLLPCFASPRVNIGCDETFDVGYGRSRGDVANRGRGAVYAEFVAKVAAAARRLGAKADGRMGRPMFWADIALREPGVLRELPEDLIALAWGYEPDTAFGDWCDTCRANGVPGAAREREIWVCPGTSAWRSIVGRTAERRENVARAAREGGSHGAAGFLMTEWGDLGHRQQWPVALHALADGAAAAWNAEAGAAAFDAHAAAFHLFGDATGALGEWLERLGDVDRNLRMACGPPGSDGRATRLRNAGAMFADMEQPLQGSAALGSIEAWRATSVRLDELADMRPVTHDALIGRELEHTLGVARYAVRRALLRRAINGEAANRTATPRWLTDDLNAIVDEHRALWLKRSRPGGLDDSCRWYRRAMRGVEA